MYSKQECSQKAKAIEKAIHKKFSWSVSVTVEQDGRVSWDGHPEKNKDRYDLYPGMSKQQADAAVMSDILKIIQVHIPHFQYTSFYQSGKMHYPGR
jgi:hypothetical protein